MHETRQKVPTKGKKIGRSKRESPVEKTNTVQAEKIETNSEQMCHGCTRLSESQWERYWGILSVAVQHTFKVTNVVKVD